MARLEKIIRTAARWLNWIAGGSIIAIMIIVCVNVVGRSAFGMPFKGTVDIVSLLGALAIAGAIAYTQVIKRHIRITLFVDKLPPRARSVINAFTSLISLGLFSLITWQSLLFAKRNYDIGELSEVVKLPIVPFALAVSLGFLILTLVLLMDFLGIFTGGEAEE